LRGFGDSSVNFELRFWIEDPRNGRATITSQLLLKIWDKFHEHGVQIPYPQRDLHIRSVADDADLSRLGKPAGSSEMTDSDEA
jgi:small-conductance mechanosensitive channel